MRYFIFCYRMKLKTLLLANFKSIPRGPNKKLDLYKCKFCTQEYAFHVTRMCKHLVSSCRACPDQIKSVIQTQQKRKNPDKRDTFRKRKREDSSSEDDIDNLLKILESGVFFNSNYSFLHDSTTAPGYIIGVKNSHFPGTRAPEFWGLLVLLYEVFGVSASLFVSISELWGFLVLLYEVLGIVASLLVSISELWGLFVLLLLSVVYVWLMFMSS